MAEMKTTVVLHSGQLAEAMAAAGVRTKREAIEAGLRLLISESRRTALRRQLGSFELELDGQRLRRQRDGG